MAVIRFLFVAASLVATAVLGLAAPAAAAPSGTGNAQDTINSLQANGYNVIVNRLSDAPLDRATVVAVRPGRPVTQRATDSVDAIGKLSASIVYVDVK
jgi:hypothetical protein